MAFNILYHHLVVYPCYNDGNRDTEVIIVIYNDFDLTLVNDLLYIMH